MTYPAAIQFLHSLRLFGAKFGLEITLKLAALSGNPQAKLRFIHVAGTNGKGSTCAMLESIYRAAGLRVGLFTSPHLVSFRERIQVNRHLISEEEVCRLVEEIQPLLKEFPDDQHPTFFEVVTLMALKFFAAQKCDLVVWETGLGGRLDATNIVTPLASVITNIALDHQQWLGDTLEKIAAEKAGIIKPGVPVVTTTDAPEALEVIERVAHQKGAPLTKGISPVLSRDTATLTLAGVHQKTNAALALATVEILQSKIPVRQVAIHQGLATVSWPGRLQMIQRPGGQKILLDGAHNAAGALALREALSAEAPVSDPARSVEIQFSPSSADKLKPGLQRAGAVPGAPAPVIIFGALADKKWEEICAILAPLADRVYTVPVASERTANARDLAAAFRVADPKLEAVAMANLEEALIACKDKPFVLITGSLYLVGEALERLGFSPEDAGGRSLNDWTAPQISR